MSTTISPKRYSLEEYLEMDRTSEGRWEYIDGKIFEMSGVQPNHAELESNLNAILKAKLASRGCKVYPANLRIVVPALPPYRYADLSATCDKPEFEEIGGLQCLRNPRLIVEVLSPTTEAYDRGEKFSGYKSIASLRDYLLLAQDSRLVTMFSRHNERFWLQSEWSAGESLRIESLDCDLSVDEIYAGITFEAEARS